MTIERFYDTLNLILSLDKDLRLQSSLDAIKVSLSSLVQSPAVPAQQQALATALAAFDSSSASLAEALSPSDHEAISEVGGREFFDPAIAGELRASVGTNAMTPSVARDYVLDLATRREEFLDTVKQTLSGLKTLGVSAPEIPSGHADVAFVIPRDIFDNKLELFAKELVFFSRLIEHISEALTGSPETAALETLSSSTPTVAVMAGIGVLSALASTVNSFLDAWKKVQDFRAARNTLTGLGITGAPIDAVNEQIQQVVEEVVETTTTTIITSYNGDSTRRNELTTALQQDTRRLFGQIERGLVVQFRAEPEAAEATDTTQAMLTNIDNIGRHLVFPTPDNAPLLLTTGQLIEGDIVIHSSTVKKTATKQAAKKAAASAKS